VKEQGNEFGEPTLEGYARFRLGQLNEELSSQRPVKENEVGRKGRERIEREVSYLERLLGELPVSERQGAYLGGGVDEMAVQRSYLVEKTFDTRGNFGSPGV
jgi:hypothetical protein